MLGFGQAFIAFLQQGEIVRFFLKEMLIFVRTHEEYDSSVAITADKQGSNNSGAELVAIAAAIGNIMPNVPQLVPVENAIAEPRINKITGKN